MFSAIKYQMEVRRLNQQLHAVERHYQSIRDGGTMDNAPPPLNEEWRAKNAIRAKIFQLETASLLERAAREKVPTPDYEDEDTWIESQGGGQHLSQSGYANLRAAIRKERNEKWEFRLKVLGLLGSTAIGMIGALIGLVTALKK